MKQRVYKRYSQAFKLHVVSEYESGASTSELRLKYGIGGGSTIGKWIEKYAREGYRSKAIRIQKADEYKELKATKKKIFCVLPWLYWEFGGVEMLFSIFYAPTTCW